MQADDYRIPSLTRIGHVHLKGADLLRSLGFYCGLLDFEITAMYGADAAFISAGGYHRHIGLNTWYSKTHRLHPFMHPDYFTLLSFILHEKISL